LKECDDEVKYQSLKNNDNLIYDLDTVTALKELIPVSTKFFTNKINDESHSLYVSSKETYISYFVKVKYIPEADIPKAEDIHIPYEVRYIRSCRWFTVGEIMELEEKDFHKRLQITKILQRIKNYLDNGAFV